MKHKPPVIDAEFIRYPRELGGNPAPKTLDVEASLDAFIRGDWREKMVNDVILKDFYEKECASFIFGNRK